MSNDQTENQAAKSVCSIDWLEFKSDDGKSAIEFLNGEIFADICSHNINSNGFMVLNHQECRMLYETMKTYYSNIEDKQLSNRSWR